MRFPVLSAVTLLLLCVNTSLDAGTPITSIAFHPATSTLVWNGDRMLHARNPATESENRAIPLPVDRIRDLAFHPDGRFLAVAGGAPGEHGSVTFLNWPQAQILWEQRFEGDWSTCVAFSPDGKHLAIGSGKAALQIYGWDATQSGSKLEASLEGHAGAIMDLVFDTTSRWLVSAGSDRSLKIWDHRQSLLHRTYSHHTEMVYATSLRPVPTERASAPFYVATASGDRTVRVWQPEIGRMVRIVRKHPAEIFAVAYHPSGNWMASAGKDGVIRCIDADSDRIIREIEAHRDWVYTLAFSPDGSYLASGDWSGRLRIHSVEADLSSVTEP